MKEGFLIIVGGGILSMPAYRIAREELGVKIISFDQDISSPGMLYADLPIQVSTKDIVAVVQKTKELMKHHSIIGVFTCGADVEVTVSAISETLGLSNTVSLDVAKRCNDKLLMHQFLDEIGFDQKPKYRTVQNFSSLVCAVKEIGYPCVIKPIDNCASRGVQIVFEEKELESAYDLASSFKINSSTNLLLEEYLQGSKHTVEMICYKGDWHVLSIVDTHYISPVWPCEIGLNTTTLNQQQQNIVTNFAIHAAKSIGIDIGAHKVDINLSEKNEVRLIELTARLSGGFHCQYASPLAFGSSDIKAALKIAIGYDLCLEDIKHKFNRGAAVRCVFPPTGKITSIEGVEDARQMPGVAEVFVWKKVGDRVGPYHNSSDRFAFVIASGTDTETAISNAEQAILKIKIQTIGDQDE